MALFIMLTPTIYVVLPFASLPTVAYFNEVKSTYYVALPKLELGGGGRIAEWIVYQYTEEEFFFEYEIDHKVEDANEARGIHYEYFKDKKAYLPDMSDYDFTPDLRHYSFMND